MAIKAFLAILDFRQWCVSEKTVHATEPVCRDGWEGTSEQW